MRPTDSDPSVGPHRRAGEVVHEAIRTERLTRADRMDAPRGWPTGVPERIVQYWHDDVLPDDVRTDHERVVALHPDARCELFSQVRAREFLAAEFPADVVAAFDHSVHHAMRCDLFRLCDLYVHGGAYLDVDLACESPLHGLFPAVEFDCFLLFWRPAEGRVVIRNDVIAAPPGSAFVSRLIDLVVANVSALHAGEHFASVRMVSGPGAINAWFADLVAEGGDPERLLEHVVVAPWASAHGILRHSRMSYDASADGNWRSWRDGHGR